MPLTSPFLLSSATATSTSALSSGRSRPPARTPRAAPSCTSPRTSPLYVFLSLPAFFLISSPYSHPLPERRHRRRRLRPGRREGPREERPRPGDHERRQPRVLRGEQPGAGLSTFLIAQEELSFKCAGLSSRLLRRIEHPLYFNLYHSGCTYPGLYCYRRVECENNGRKYRMIVGF